MYSCAIHLRPCTRVSYSLGLVFIFFFFHRSGMEWFSFLSCVPFEIRNEMLRFRETKIGIFYVFRARRLWFFHNYWIPKRLTTISVSCDVLHVTCCCSFFLSFFFLWVVTSMVPCYIDPIHAFESYRQRDTKNTQRIQRKNCYTWGNDLT